MTPILVFLGFSVLGPMYLTERQMEFCFGHDNFKPSGAGKGLTGGHCLLGADQT